MGKTHFPATPGSGNEWAAMLSQYQFGLPVGNVFFVSSLTGVDGSGYGRSPDSPLATIDYAVGLCTANNHDHIIVMPGHAETVSAANGLDFDVAGITVIGLSSGSGRPTVTLGTATTATVRINAANVTVRNLLFVSNIDSLAVLLNINADYASVEDCEFRSSSAKECVCFVSIATTKDFASIRRCVFLQPTDPAGTDGAAETGGIFLVDSEHVTIEECKFAGNFETAIFHNRTTGAANLWIRDCYGIQNLSGAEPFQLASGATGGVIGGGFITPAEAAVTEATLSGTLPAGFFAFGTRFGNDGGGGQNAVLLADAS